MLGSAGLSCWGREPLWLSVATEPDDAWEMLLNAAKDAPEGNDNSMGLRMETVLWLPLGGKAFGASP